LLYAVNFFGGPHGCGSNRLGWSFGRGSRTAFKVPGLPGLPWKV